MQNLGYAQYNIAKAVTPSDTTPVTCSAILVCTAGQLTIAFSIGGTPVDLKTTIPAGTVIPICLQNGTINAATAAVVVALQ